MKTTKLLTFWLSILALTLVIGCGPEKESNPTDVIDTSDVPDPGDAGDVAPTDLTDSVGPTDLEESKDEPEIETDTGKDSDELDEVSQPDEEVIEPPTCALTCSVNADCEGVLDDLGDCEVATCQPVQSCQEDEDPDNDKQCIAAPIPGCCEVDADCVDDSVCTCNEKCVNLVCQSELCSPLPEECCQNQVVRKFDFDNLAVGSMPAPDQLYQDTHITKEIKWSVQEGPCGSNALYLGDPACKTYYNGQFAPNEDCLPVVNIECTEDNEDVDCPEPAQSCNQFPGSPLGNCIAEPAPGKVDVDLIVPEMSIPADALVTATFRLWMDAEDVPGTEIDKLLVYAEKSDGSFSDMVYSTTELDNNSTGGQCLMVSVDLSKYAGDSIDLRFKFNTADGNSNAYEGVYIDDLTIRTYCESALCTVSSECADEDKCTTDTCTPFSNVDGQGVCNNFMLDPFCVECTNGTDQECAGKGPFPGNECYPPKCIQDTLLCEWLPDPNCCNPADLGDPYHNEGFEAGDLDIAGYTVTEMPGSNGIAWHLATSAGLDNEGVPDFDTFSIQFSNPAGDSYDCGIDNCWGKIASPTIDLTDVTPNAFVKLTFLLNMSTEWDALENAGEYQSAGIDVLKVFAVPEGTPENSPDNLVWTSDDIAGSTHGAALPMWADLSKHAGKKVKLIFTFETGDVDPPNNDFAGPIVDEIVVESVCDEVCSAATDCTEGAPCDDPQCVGGACDYSLSIQDCCTVEADPLCDDQNDCTTDSCNVDDKVCVHEYTNDPQCCSEQAFVFYDNFEDETTYNPLQLPDPGNATWTVPKTNPACGDGFCADNESSEACPYDCNQAPVSWHRVDFDSFSGDSALYFGDPETKTYEAEPAAMGVFRGPAFKMPPYGTPKVSFKLLLETEHCSSWSTFVEPVPYDVLTLSVVSADATDSAVWSNPILLWDSMAWDIKGCTYDAGQGKAVWKTVEVNLGMASQQAEALKGKALRFQFEFTSLDDFDNNFLGALVDDFSVDVVCDDACYSPYDCPETDLGQPHCSIETCNQGQCGSTVNSLKEGCCVQDVIAGFDFDGPCGMDGWTAQPATGQPRWQPHNGQAMSPTCALYFGDPNTGTYNKPGAVPQGVATSPDIDLSDHVQVEISYCLWLDLADASYFLDFYTLSMDQVLFAGQPPIGSPVTLMQKPCDDIADEQCSQAPVTAPCDVLGCGTLLNSQWFCESIILDTTEYEWVDFGGGSHLAAFQFSFNAGDTGGNMGEGIYVDDFKVKTLCQ